MSWINQLENDLREEFGDRPRVVTLATINGDQPDARSIVLRQLIDDGSMLFTSDARSEKNRQVRLNPAATIVVWLPRLRRQYRVDGQLDILDISDPVREQHWRESSDASRAMFFWPPPGDVFDPATITPMDVNSLASIPPAFEVLRLHPRGVQTLDLNHKPHVRFRWTTTEAREFSVWSSQRINP